MYRIGIDEVGRGPLAGPVVVAAVVLPPRMRLPKTLGPLRDSKKMSSAARERWYNWIVTHLTHQVARSSAQSIDKRNISACANACALRCYLAIRPDGKHVIQLDGGLFLGTKKQRAAFTNTKTTPKADEDHPEVALASILAKVTRDRMMMRYDQRYPGYGFSRHVGYGTKAHYEALKTHGPSPIHRLTFLRSLGTMTPLL